ncbi:hypothetical protein WJX73_004254 [Symbiochloris irregularis]|uniref:VDE lipocalin domain-containing protein n=1 Tax=Symbiochloris irregularis TaxID=706552 RepID=A0AAW1PFP6_9CHLO
MDQPEAVLRLYQRLLGKQAVPAGVKPEDAARSRNFDVETRNLLADKPQYPTATGGGGSHGNQAQYRRDRPAMRELGERVWYGIAAREGVLIELMEAAVPAATAMSAHMEPFDCATSSSDDQGSPRASSGPDPLLLDPGNMAPEDPPPLRPTIAIPMDVGSRQEQQPQCQSNTEYPAGQLDQGQHQQGAAATAMQIEACESPSAPQSTPKSSCDLTQAMDELDRDRLRRAAKTGMGFFAAAVLLSAALVAGPSSAADLVGTGECLLQNCKIPLGKCLTDGGCASNLICLQRCNGRPDETECQLRCTQVHENPVVKEFNTCAVSEHGCVKQRVSKPGDSQYYGPPPQEALDENFDLSKYTGKWYISAGLNSAFDVFPCQDHYFSSPEQGHMKLALNWRIPENGEYLERSDVQTFYQTDEKAHLINDGNKFMNYRDDWYIIASKPDAYLFVVYNGNNDAWKGYGGSTVYTK